MSFAGFLAGQERFVLFVLGAAALAGIATMTVLPVGLFPNVSFPRVVITVDAGDRPAEQMATLVTRPVEQALRDIPGVQEIRSDTSRGSADLSLNFAWGTDMAATLLQVDAAITQTLPTLPAGTSFLARRMDPTVFPIIAYSLTSDHVPLTDLRLLAQYKLAPLLSSVAGVRRVDAMGGADPEYEVLIDPQLLAARGLSIDAVTQAVSGAYALAAVGRVEDHYKLSLIVTDAGISSVADLKQTPVDAARGFVVRLGDVAVVSLGTVPQWTRVTADGKDAVLFRVYQQPGGNSVSIAKDVNAVLATYAPQMPVGVKMANWYDQSVLVAQSAASVRDAILIGIVLAALVLILFLRDWRVTLIAMIAVPATITGTVLVLGLMGMSFNIMTLGGLAAAVGLVIDDVIVMIEHIVRRREEDAGADALKSARGFTRPMTGSSLATLIIFAPLALLTGVTGAFFKALSLTMASALLISYLLSMIGVPLVARRLLKHVPGPHKADRLQRAHGRILDRLIARPLLLAILFLPILAIGGLAMLKVGTGFMPAMDEGGFVIDYYTQSGTSLAESDRVLRQAEAILMAIPDVETISRRTGLGLNGTEINESNRGDFFVRLKPMPRRPIDEVMQDAREKITRQVPGLSFELAQLMDDLIGDLTAVPQPIEVKLIADDPATLNQAAPAIADAIGKVQGVVDVNNGIIPAGNAIDVRIDPVKAAAEGMSADAVTKMLDGYLTGTVATSVPLGIQQAGIRVRMDPILLATDSSVGQIQLRAPDGHMFPLKRIAAFTTIEGQPHVTRDNLQQIVAITARIEGRDLGSAVNDVKKVLDAKDILPRGVSYTLGGLYQQQQIAFHGMMLVFIAAAAAEFALLLFLYRRFLVAGVVLASSVMSSLAVFIGLWITGVELNITAMMGLTMIIGIGTEMAIFYVSEVQLLEASMPRHEALRQASVNRFRPITMTTLAAILTLLPLAFAIGQGSEMQQPLAIAIISGLCLQFPVVVLALPVLLSLLPFRNETQEIPQS